MIFRLPTVDFFPQEEQITQATGLSHGLRLSLYIRSNISWVTSHYQGEVEDLTLQSQSGK